MLFYSGVIKDFLQEGATGSLLGIAWAPRCHISNNSKRGKSSHACLPSVCITICHQIATASPVPIAAGRVTPVAHLARPTTPPALPQAGVIAHHEGAVPIALACRCDDKITSVTLLPLVLGAHEAVACIPAAHKLPGQACWVWARQGDQRKHTLRGPVRASAARVPAVIRQLPLRRLQPCAPVRLRPLQPLGVERLRVDPACTHGWPHAFQGSAFWAGKGVLDRSMHAAPFCGSPLDALQHGAAGVH